MTDDPTLVGGRYELSEPLGRGGMATVRRGLDLRLDRAVAVKLLSRTLAADPTFRERFRREALAIARLNHPAIAAVYDSGEEADPETGVARPYIVMELVEGTTLRDVLAGRRPLLPQRALELTRGVLEALAHSHAAGIIHRDIKPANVMLTPTGAVKVMDFGIARAATDTSEGLTQTAAVIGTAQYLSPEQARGETVDLRSDLYSTGCLLYELLLGRPPFEGESSISVAYQHVREDPVPPSRLDPSIAASIDVVTLKALAKHPDDRYQSANEMAADLTRVLAGQPVEADLATSLRTVPVGAGTTVAMGAAALTEATRALPRTAPVAGPVAQAVGAAAVADEPRRSRVGVIAVVAVLVLALAAVGLYQLFGGTEAATTVVKAPSVLGQSPAQAEAQLQALGLETKVENVAGEDDKTVDTVVEQRPPGGSELAPGTLVTLEVNTGPESAEIPGDLIGKSVGEVKQALEDAGFTNVETKESDDAPSSADQDEVFAIDPGEGSAVGLDERIEISYAAGESEETTTEPSATSEPTDDPTESSSPPPSEDPEESEEPEESDEPDESAEPSASATSESRTEPSKSAKANNTNKPVKQPKPTKAPKNP